VYILTQPLPCTLLTPVTVDICLLSHSLKKTMSTHQTHDEVAPPVDTNTHETGHRRHHPHLNLKPIAVIGHLKTKVRRIHSERPSAVLTNGEHRVNGHKPNHAETNGKVSLRATQSVSTNSSPQISEKGDAEHRTFLEHCIGRARSVASSL
jgi:hypothetical protein